MNSYFSYACLCALLLLSGFVARAGDAAAGWLVVLEKSLGQVEREKSGAGVGTLIEHELFPYELFPRSDTWDNRIAERLKKAMDFLRQGTFKFRDSTTEDVLYRAAMIYGGFGDFFGPSLPKDFKAYEVEGWGKEGNREWKKFVALLHETFKHRKIEAIEELNRAMKYIDKYLAGEQFLSTHGIFTDALGDGKFGKEKEVGFWRKLAGKQKEPAKAEISINMGVKPIDLATINAAWLGERALCYGFVGDDPFASRQLCPRYEATIKEDFGKSLYAPKTVEKWKAFVKKVEKSVSLVKAEIEKIRKEYVKVG